MSRLSIETPGRAETVVEGLYRDVERRIVNADLPREFEGRRRRADDGDRHGENGDRIDQIAPFEFVFRKTIAGDGTGKNAQPRSEHGIPHAVEDHIEKRDTVIELQHGKRLRVIGKQPFFGKRKGLAQGYADGVFRPVFKRIDDQPKKGKNERKRVKRK